jgi:hypothetical protein
MEAEWRRQGKTDLTIGRQRIGLANVVLKTPDAVWTERRDVLRRILELTPEDWAAKKDAILEAIGPE